MNATVEYTTQEVEKIILAHHEKFIPAPDNMKWEVSMKSYGSGAQCFLVEITPERKVGQ